MRSQHQIFTLGLLALLLLAACSPAADSNALAGTRWELHSLDGNDQVGAAIGGQPVTLSFDSATEVSGSGGCNGFGGSYSADANAGSISFSELVSTLMACQAEGVGEVEAQYFAALNAATDYSVSADTLTITGAGHTLIFVRA